MTSCAKSRKLASCSRRSLEKACVLFSTLVCLLINLSCFAGSREIQATYFRTKISLEYAGKPFEFNIVVGCRTGLTHYDFGGSSSDKMSVSAVSFAQATPDGHAIGVQTLPPGGYDFCGGATTANGRVQADYMPLVVWFDDKDLLSDGIGYRTPAAFTRANSRLKFNGATVEATSREDFEDFRDHGPKNLFPADQVDWLDRPRENAWKPGAVPPEFIADPRKAWRDLTTRGCFGVARIRLTSQQREIVRAYWPSSRPLYWQPPNRDDGKQLENDIPGQDHKFDQISFSPKTYYSDKVEVFPAASSNSIGKLTSLTRSDNRYYYDVSIDNAKAGSMYCSQYPTKDLEEAVTNRTVTPAENQILYLRVNDTLLPRKMTFGTTGFNQFYQRDEFVIVSLSPLPF